MGKPTVLLITPPLTQLNTPYPATAYLAGFLGSKGYKVAQLDLGIEFINAIFCKDGLSSIIELPVSNEAKKSFFYTQRHTYLQTIDPLISFMKNKDMSLAHRIVGRTWLPEGPRFAQLEEDLDWAFGNLGIHDKARYLGTLYLEDIGDYITEHMDASFSFTRYKERVAMSATSFKPLLQALERPNSFLDDIITSILDKTLSKKSFDLVGLSVPFPGNVYGAFKCGQHIKRHYPSVKTVMGGGYVNTELRSISDPDIFNFVDFITLDDGEGPILSILDHLEGTRPIEKLQRTFVIAGEQVRYHNFPAYTIGHHQITTPDYSGLKLDHYISTIDMVNPMHRMWSDGRWNKLTIAHGCYWKKCSFCDVTLDYIGRYETTTAKDLVDRIEDVIKQTGQTGFHFVDEAAPPLALRDLAIELIKRGTIISWWTNIRFEKTFDKDLCALLAASGCIAVTGGLEVASDRLLQLMEKGVTIEQVTHVTDAFRDAGILVHAYLMYGFPTQTAQETVDSLEIVRQLFAEGLLQSAYWHRFALTAHSPVGKNPDKYQVTIEGPVHEGFAWNDLQHSDPTGTNHSRFTDGLNKALYNYMHGIGLDYTIQDWFEYKTPKVSVQPYLIKTHLKKRNPKDIQTHTYRLLFVKPTFTSIQKTKKGITYLFTDTKVTEPQEWNHWISVYLSTWTVHHLPTIQEVLADFESHTKRNRQELLSSSTWKELQAAGLLMLRF